MHKGWEIRRLSIENCESEGWWESIQEGEKEEGEGEKEWGDWEIEGGES